MSTITYWLSNAPSWACFWHTLEYCSRISDGIPLLKQKEKCDKKICTVSYSVSVLEQHCRCLVINYPWSMRDLSQIIYTVYIYIKYLISWFFTRWRIIRKMSPWPHLAVCDNYKVLLSVEESSISMCINCPWCSSLCLWGWRGLAEAVWKFNLVSSAWDSCSGKRQGETWPCLQLTAANPPVNNGWFI